MAFVSAEFMFQPREDNHSPSTSPNILSSCSPQDFHVAGVSSSPAQMRRSMSFSGIGSKCEEMHVDDEMSDDDGSPLGEKKRRLNMEQVKALEKSFELGNKLEPERKLQLARALGLQPRQVAIWFQNRRARWKTKQLERDYNLLKRKFEALKADNDALQVHNKKLVSELLALKGRESNGIGPINLNKETEASWSKEVRKVVISICAPQQHIKVLINMSSLIHLLRLQMLPISCKRHQGQTFSVRKSIRWFRMKASATCSPGLMIIRGFGHGQSSNISIESKPNCQNFYTLSHCAVCFG
ncbi:hypothetical protein HYC85_029707 [Camellia sinensis]|uniref:Homeobox-leucine zipper protein n=1 Tax=Camellia sinensis TaxID=4442 RepID=A0A7J7G2Q6_CAMSI|nr:hypothetical protein HYC85_029707 [Camellia sinensis]